MTDSVDKEWTDVYSWNTSDCAPGGPHGVFDKLISNLTIRTAYLKEQLEKVQQSLICHENSVRHPNASLTEKGFVQLSSALDSDSESHAATAKAIKTLYQLVHCKADSEHLHSDELPLGIPLPWPSDTPPKGWLKCNGAIFDKACYPKLAVAYPEGKLPDLRGEFIRGWDDGRGVDSERNILTLQTDSVVKHDHQSVVWAIYGAALNQKGIGAKVVGQERAHIFGGADSSGWGNINMTSQTGDHETRPRNISFLYIVRAA